MNDNPRVLTFHQVREQCEGPNANAWRAFLSFYGPLHLRLLELYSAPGGNIAPALIEKLLAALAESNFERLRATSRQSEREFLADVRVLLLDLASDEAASRTAKDARTRQQLDLEKLAKLTEGLPLMHQEMLFFKMAGYTDATIELILRIAPRVAQAAFERLDGEYGAARAIEKDGCIWPTEWLAVLRAARATKKDDCPPLHQFLRIQDGQVSWYDKEPVEKRVASCLHCLESWTALREVSYWRRAAPAFNDAQTAGYLLALPIAEAPKKSRLRRMFS